MNTLIFYVRTFLSHVSTKPIKFLRKFLRYPSSCRQNSEVTPSISLLRTIFSRDPFSFLLAVCFHTIPTTFSKTMCLRRSHWRCEATFGFIPPCRVLVISTTFFGSLVSQLILATQPFSSFPRTLQFSSSASPFLSRSKNEYRNARPSLPAICSKVRVNHAPVDPVYLHLPSLYVARLNAPNYLVSRQFPTPYHTQSWVLCRCYIHLLYHR